ncbi:MAG: GntR family transcriptional regulator, partial [Treponema sp.]|nr:GntR family transcriptional regulator [Treponema sp.]
MITVDFEKRGSLGLCDFLCESIRAQILSKKLRSGERLPSKRSLAEHLNISVVTVQNAYSRLISEGYISSVEKRGYFVSEPGSEIYRESPRVAQVWSMEEKEREREKYFADFTSNTACMERFPFTQWTKILRRILSSEKSRRIPKIDVHGAWELRCAIANYLAGFRNMDVSPDQIVIGSGSE